MKKQLKPAEGLIDFSTGDAAVDTLLSDARARKQRTPAQRKKARKDAQRNRRSIDLPPWLESRIEDKAEELGVPFSSLASYLMERAIMDVTQEELEAARVPTRSMRYEYLMKVEGSGGK